MAEHDDLRCAEDEVRAALQFAGSSSPRWQASDRDAATAAIQQVRVVRRRRVLAAAVALSVVLVGGGSTWVLTTARQTAPVAATAPSSSTGDPSAAREVTALPTRGPLAGDRAFITALEGMPGPLGIPPEEPQHVVWAGDVPEGRWALVATTVDGSPTTYWTFGEVGSAAAQMLAGFSDPVVPGAPISRTTGDLPAGGTLVVVAMPGDTVEVSQVASLDTSNQPQRSYVDVPTDDGVAVTQLTATTEFGMAASIRVTDERGQVYFRAAPTSTGGLGDTTTLIPADLVGGSIATARRGLPEIDGQALIGAVGMIARPLGLAPEQVAVTLLWNGTIGDAAIGVDREVAVVAVTVPDGSTFLGAAWSRNGSVAVPCGLVSSVTDTGDLLVPAGTAPAQVLLIAQCQTDDNPLDGQLLAVAPPGTDSIQLEQDGTVTDLDGDAGWVDITGGPTRASTVDGGEPAAQTPPSQAAPGGSPRTSGNGLGVFGDYGPGLQ